MIGIWANLGLDFAIFFQYFVPSPDFKRYMNEYCPFEVFHSSSLGLIK